MMLSTIHLNPSARVYTLRVLLVATIAIVFRSVYSLQLYEADVYWSTALIGIITFGIFVWVHHILAIFKWTLRGLAVIDLTMILIEICASTSLPHRVLRPCLRSSSPFSSGLSRS
ncbi:hypothetical protein C8R45DRAFT_116464 [Mycena sanguinolenta]|nr:hypothetical protein C8R45DRAFT_116464 [Mycena sanguinolenta]